MRKGKIKRVLADLPFYLVASLIALTFVLPLIWMGSAALRTPGLPPPTGFELLARPAAWGNYQQLFNLIPVGRYFLNSLFVSGLAAGLSLLFAAWAGFGMAQLGMQARRWLIFFSITLLMAPLMAVWLARYVLFARLGLVDSYLALLLPAITGSSPFFVLLFYWAFRRIPVELFESARLDGASPMIIWRQVAMPLALPTTATVLVFSFILYWNDFINPLLYIKTPRLYTMAIGLQQLQQLDRTNWPLLMAGSVVMTVPVVLLYFLVQKQFFLANHQ